MKLEVRDRIICNLGVDYALAFYLGYSPMEGKPISTLPRVFIISPKKWVGITHVGSTTIIEYNPENLSRMVKTYGHSHLDFNAHDIMILDLIT